MLDHLIHLLHQGIDVVFPVAQITSFDEVLEFSRMEPASWVAELEWPQKIARLLEVGSHGHDFVDQIFHTDNAQFSKLLFDDRVVGQRDALLVDFAVSALVDQIADGLDGGVSVGDVGFDNLQHLGGGLGEFDEDGVVDLEETEELEDFAGLGGDFVDTVRSASAMI